MWTCSGEYVDFYFDLSFLFDVLVLLGDKREGEREGRGGEGRRGEVGGRGIGGIDIGDLLKNII